MVAPVFDRRAVIVGLAAMGLCPAAVNAANFIDLDWADLVPAGAAPTAPVLEGLIDHDQAPLSSQQPQSNGVRIDWNGKIVRLPGFMVPLDYSGTGVSAFILVPFVGACVHVPPPPANQLVFVTTPAPYDSAGLYEPINVTGMFGTTSMSTALAEVAYSISADRVEPYSR